MSCMRRRWPCRWCAPAGFDRFDRLPSSIHRGGSPTRIEFGSATGPAFQFGVQVNPVGRRYVDAMLFTALLKSKATLSTGSTADVKVNPLVTNLSVGYRF
jgi:outer membrane protein W